MSRLAKFFRLSAADRWLVVETAFWLGLARAMVISLPFRWVASILQGRQPDGAPIAAPPAAAAASSAAANESLNALETPQQTSRVAWALRRTSRYTPWRSNCLAKAIAGRYMLRRRRIGSTLYFGMTRGADGDLAAHAWLESGGVTLTGGANLDRYAVVATFIDRK